MQEMKNVVRPKTLPSCVHTIGTVTLEILTIPQYKIQKIGPRSEIEEKTQPKVWRIVTVKS
jgi:hypothetical protein